MTDLNFLSTLNRLSTLNKFKDLLEYFSSSNKHDHYRNLSFDDIKEERENIRTQINQLMPKVKRFMLDTRQYPFASIEIRGKVIQNFDVLENIFNLREFAIPMKSLIDSIDRGIGYYRDDLFASFIRTINLFWWLMQLIKNISTPTNKLDKLEETKQSRIFGS